MNITLIPFSIDPYGSFGYFANRLLYDPPPPDKPPWKAPSDFTSKAAYKAFNKASSSPHSFLAIANSKYVAITPFGHTHSTRTRTVGNSNTRPKFCYRLVNFPPSGLRCYHSSPYNHSPRYPQITQSPARGRPGLLPSSTSSPRI